MLMFTDGLCDNETDAAAADYAQQLQFQIQSLNGVFESLHGVAGAERRAEKIAEDIEYCESALRDLGMPCAF